MKKSDAWSKKQIETHQLEQLKKIVQHAYTNTTGYKWLFDQHQVHPDNIISTANLSEFPMVSKEDIRDNLEKFSSPSKEKQYITTGGSTGVPFGFYRNPTIFARELASKAHQYYRRGWNENMRQIVLRGLPIENKKHIDFIPQFNELRFSSYHLTEETMEQYYQASLEYQPDFLRCYPSAGYIFASFLKETNKRLPLRGILCASENLYDHQKKLLEEVFESRVFSHYGNYELTALAGYCEHADTYHVLPEYSYVELVNGKGKTVTTPGEMGEIVGTSFLMTETPFIRYRTRDFATLQSQNCDACGRPYQVWSRVDGRLQEFIITKHGNYVPMTAINMHDDTFDELKQFQFHQKKPGKLTLKYIPKQTCSRESLNHIEKRLLSKLENQVSISFKEVEAIPLTSRGKHRFLIQEAPLQFGD